MTVRPSGTGADAASTTSTSAPVQNQNSRRSVRTASRTDRCLRAAAESHTRTTFGLPPDTSVTGGCTGAGNAVTGLIAGCTSGSPPKATEATQTAAENIQTYLMWLVV